MMNWNAKSLAVGAWVALLMTPALAAAQGGIDVADDAAEEAELGEEELEGDTEDAQRPWGVTASISTLVGQGTFASPSNDTEWAGEVDDGSGAWNRWNMVYSITPSYQLGDFSFDLTLTWVQWLTSGGGIRTTSVAGGANEPYEFRFQDPSLSVGWKSYTHDGVGVTLTPSASIRLPGDAISRNNTLLADIGAGVTATRSFFDDLTLSASLSGSRWFHRYTSPVLDVDEVGIDNVLYRPGGAEDLEPGRVAVDGYNLQYRLSPVGSASFSMTDSLSASISYGIHNYWTYNVERDESLDGEHVRDGRGFSQTAASSVSFSYAATDMLTMALNFNTIQTPKTADNKSYRFPFWNFSNPASNSSGVQFSVQGTY